MHSTSLHNKHEKEAAEEKQQLTSVLRQHNSSLDPAKQQDPPIEAEAVPEMLKAGLDELLPTDIPFAVQSSICSTH